MGSNILDLPNFRMDETSIPSVNIKSIRIQNLKGYKDYTFDFSNEGETCKSFVCFHGPNGTGKTTVLDVVQLIFSRFDNYEKDRLRALLGKSVRHEDGNMSGIYGDDDFLITAEIKVTSWGLDNSNSMSLSDSYIVRINKNGFIDDHPEHIKNILYRLCFYARLDNELHQFQLSREKWPIFKELCEAVTGYEIEEKSNVFDISEDPIQADLMNKYVLGFWVKKPHEKISHTECSAGERKVIKSFSTMLNMEYTPRIICIDNATMHVELERHIALIEAIKRCFEGSQIFATTHSYRMSRNFGDKNQMYDLRLVNDSKKESWQLEIYDELSDSISKLRSFSLNPQVVNGQLDIGLGLQKRCFNEGRSLKFFEEVGLFLKRVIELHIEDMYNT